MIDHKKDKVLEFDLKGSKWKHRLTAGMRCSPVFPLSFWEKGGPGSADGEDFDFLALRTQDTREFCQKLATQFVAAEKAIPDFSNKFTHMEPCMHAIATAAGGIWKGPWSDEELENAWQDDMLEEKMSLEAVRAYFGYMSRPETNMQQKLLAIEPTLRARFIRQLKTDIQLLRRHGLMDYSLALVIKNEPTALNCSTAGQQQTESTGSVF